MNSATYNYDRGCIVTEAQPRSLYTCQGYYVAKTCNLIMVMTYLTTSQVFKHVLKMVPDWVNIGHQAVISNKEARAKLQHCY